MVCTPRPYLFNTTTQLEKKLRNFCLHPDTLRQHRVDVNPNLYAWPHLQHAYEAVLGPAGKQDKPHEE